MAVVSSDPLIGREVDGYYIEKLLGRGGMARVYRGYDIHLHRYVALKIISPDLKNNQKYEERFKKEARAVAQLRHPNIVGVYRFGMVDDIYYMAMDYIAGTDLEWIMEDYYRDGELLSYAEIYRLISKVAKALDYAHEQGVYHRDVKPSNIMLDESGEPIVTDFGLAMIVSERTSGDVFGSPYYISPEQAVNSANAIPQSDLYSLGVILYKMLTGSTPFNEDTPMQIAMAHMIKQPPRPKEFYPDIHPAFEPLLNQALAKKPEERFKTGALMVRALKKAITEAEKSTGKPPTESRRASQVKSEKPLLRLSDVVIAEKITKFRQANPLPAAPPVLDQSRESGATPTQKQEVQAVPKPKHTQPVAVYHPPAVHDDLDGETLPAPHMPQKATPTASPQETKKRRSPLPMLLLLLLIVVIGGGGVFFLMNNDGGTNETPSGAVVSASNAVTMVIEGQVQRIDDNRAEIFGFNLLLPDDPRFDDLDVGDTLWVEAGFTRTDDAIQLRNIRTVAINSVIIELPDEE